MKKIFYNDFGHQFTVVIDAENNTIDFIRDNPKAMTEPMYDFPLGEWNIPERDWRGHMLRKSWFTTGMAEWIDEQTKK